MIVPLLVQTEYKRKNVKNISGNTIIAITFSQWFEFFRLLSAVCWPSVSMVYGLLCADDRMWVWSEVRCMLIVSECGILSTVCWPSMGMVCCPLCACCMLTICERFLLSTVCWTSVNLGCCVLAVCERRLLHVACLRFVILVCCLRCIELCERGLLSVQCWPSMSVVCCMMCWPSVNMLHCLLCHDRLYVWYTACLPSVSVVWRLLCADRLERGLLHTACWPSVSVVCFFPLTTNHGYVWCLLTVCECVLLCFDALWAAVFCERRTAVYWPPVCVVCCLLSAHRL